MIHIRISTVLIQHAGVTLTDSSQHSGHLPTADDGVMPVPVYDCHVILSAADEPGVIHARVTTLPEITAAGRSEREILKRIVADFKTALIGYRERGEPIPWQEPEKPGEGETQRWVPVHL